MPNAAMVAIGVVADMMVGDPRYAWHPVRLIGGTLAWMEERLRGAGLDGYGGGIALFVALGAVSLGTVAALVLAANAAAAPLAWLIHAFLCTACWHSATCCITCGRLKVRFARATCRAPATE